VGCISLQDEGAGMVSPQQRIGFTPTVQEIVELMELHSGRAKNPIFSFGQGCEGEPLTEAPLLAESIAAYRKGPLGMGTVNVNTNGSLPQAMPPLIRSGLSSIRVSLNSAVPGHYHAYYRPRGYVFEDVRQTVLEAKKGGLFVSLNLLFFPGVTDTECEAEALAEFVRETEVDFIQMRNLSLDPEMYLDLSHDWDLGPSMGLKHFLKRIKKAAPWVGIGYFNPFLPDKLK
jgi:molybdenum cofactor biosynthesis enzyme MoaA